MFAGLLLAACSSPQVEDTGKGIVVNLRPDSPSEAKKVRLEVLGEKLIHVSATPENKFADPQSLVIVPQTQKVSYTIKESDGDVTISTSEISATVSKTTGEITFYDKDGKTTKVTSKNKIYVLLESMSIAFRSYLEVEDYSKGINKKIYNITEGSYIDAFERMKIK